MAWSQNGAQGSARIRERENQTSNNRHYLQLNATSNGFGVTNSGFRGIGVRQGAEYVFSLQAQNNGAPITLRIELVSASGQVVGQTKLRNIKGEWKPYRVTIRANGTDTKAQLKVIAETSGTVDLDMISLFPKDTWKGRSNGMRADLVKLLAQMKPGFLRLCSIGCIPSTEVQYISWSIKPNRFKTYNTDEYYEELRFLDSIAFELASSLESNT